MLKSIHSRAELEEAVTDLVATLELARLGSIRAEQRRIFAEIYLRPGRHKIDPKLIGEEGKGGTDAP